MRAPFLSRDGGKGGDGNGVRHAGHAHPFRSAAHGAGFAVGVRHVTGLGSSGARPPRALAYASRAVLAAHRPFPGAAQRLSRRRDAGAGGSEIR